MKTSSFNIAFATLVFIFWTNLSICWTRPAAPLYNAVPDAQNSMPSGWRKIDADGKFSFYLPQDMRLTGRGLDSSTREYSNGRIQVSFDYQPNAHVSYSSRATAFGNNFQETELQVDGKKSFLFVYEARDYKNRPVHKADLYVGDLPNSKVIIWMSVSSRSPQAIETAKTIFSTIKF